jgi:hypothetical protein
MSVAFLEPVTLWREPVSASVRRVAGRALVAAAWIVLGGIPGVFVGVVPWTWLRVVLWIFAAIALVHVLLAVANLARNRGVLLRLMGTGSIEWPASLQEKVLRRPLDWVEGPIVTVAEELGQVTGSRAEPRVTLVGGTRTMRRLPLHGATLEHFVSTVNERAVGRGVRFELAALPDGADAPDPGEGPSI